MYYLSFSILDLPPQRNVPPRLGKKYDFPLFQNDALLRYPVILDDGGNLLPGPIYLGLSSVYSHQSAHSRRRKHRRIATVWLNQRAVDSYTPILDREATVLVKAMYQESNAGAVPINPQPHAGLFGIRTGSICHPFVVQALKLSCEFMNTTGPVSNLVDFIPFMQRFRTPIQARGQRLHRDLVDTYGGFIRDIEHRMQMGNNMDHLDMSILASAFMIGGVETTAAIMQWFSALIPAYPDIQQRAHEELDRVVGRDRPPTVEDEKAELNAATTRSGSVPPHVASEDFGGERKFRRSIPAGPLDVRGRVHSPQCSRCAVADSYRRRRICPGMIVAEREIWLTISRMLWAFRMESLPDEPIDLKEYDGLSGRSPVPFRNQSHPAPR
ncbi:cytochrome P450 [Mycena rebaudengoi]|nr:cytochrome P450 [Mycena rebaudengoi]